MSYLSTYNEIDRDSLITGVTVENELFPDFLPVLHQKYTSYIDKFIELVKSSKSTEALFRKIRSQQLTTNKDERMAYLKLFRRCACSLCDTESTKKIQKYSSDRFIEMFGDKFRGIKILQESLTKLSAEQKYALAMLLGEYDTRGQKGYKLTSMFFDWFNKSLKNEFTIEGPEGAGKDPQLSDLLDDFDEKNFPCDFIIRKKSNKQLVAVGFARYDSTRGGSQSFDRTSSNKSKATITENYFKISKNRFKLIFLADGPGLLHKDIWEKACELDDSLNGGIRVITLKLAQERISKEWLNSKQQ